MADKSRKSIAEQYQGPWMKPEVLGQLPQLGWSFEVHGNPQQAQARLYSELPETVRAQHSAVHETDRKKTVVEHEKRFNRRVFNQKKDHAINGSPAQNKTMRDDQDRTETERGDSERTDGRGSSMVGKQKPQANLRPPEHIARPVHKNAFRYAWLKEQRDAVMAQAKAARQDQSPERNQDITNEPALKGPERS